MNDSSTCSNCKHWRPITEFPGFGKCKASGPTWVRPGQPGQPSASAWGVTPANEECGSWTSYLPAKVVTAGATEVLAARSEGTVPAIEPPPVEEVRTAPEPAAEPPVDLAAAGLPMDAVAPATPLATNQIAQLVRGKRQPGQRME